MKIHFFLTVTLAVFTIAGCKKSAADSDRLALLSTDKKWSAAVAGGDIEQIVSFWADDAIVYFPGKPSVVGKEAIRELVNKNRATPGFSVTTRSGEAIVSNTGDLGYTLGTFQLSLDDLEGNAISRNGNYVHIWGKQVDGSWKCVVEISNFRSSTDKQLSSK